MEVRLVAHEMVDELQIGFRKRLKNGVNDAWLNVAGQEPALSTKYTGDEHRGHGWPLIDSL